MIELQDVDKRYGRQSVLAGVSFNAPAGAVTAFVGANGAGKTTSLRILLGLEPPSSGRALIAGKPYAELDEPASVVGAALDSGLHPGRRTIDHLRVYAAVARASSTRVEQCLAVAGLEAVRDQHARELSTGMRTRLRLATALLGNPSVLVLDEPGAGLDFHGTRWLQQLVRQCADAGGTVLMSSHDLGTMSTLADRAVFIDNGRVRGSFELEELRERELSFDVSSAEADRLQHALRASGATVAPAGANKLRVLGATAEEIGRVAQFEGAIIQELRPSEPVLQRVAAELSTEDAP